MKKLRFYSTKLNQTSTFYLISQVVDLEWPLKKFNLKEQGPDYKPISLLTSFLNSFLFKMASKTAFHTFHSILHSSRINPTTTKKNNFYNFFAKILFKINFQIKKKFKSKSIINKWPKVEKLALVFFWVRFI